MLIDKVTPGISAYARGDIVLLKGGESIFFGYVPATLRRIIGQPGDTIDFDNGIVYVTPPSGPRRAVRLEEPYVVRLPDGTSVPECPRDGITVCTPPWLMDEGQYFVVGDNRPEPGLSFGQIYRDRFEGRVWLRFFPLDRFGIFDPPTYAGLE